MLCTHEYSLKQNTHILNDFVIQLLKEKCLTIKISSNEETDKIKIRKKKIKTRKKTNQQKTH